MARRNKFNSGMGEQKRMAETLDDLEEFESFKKDILPKLRREMQKGSSAEDIFKMVTPLLAGKLASMALTTKDNKESMAMIKDILDRSQGKARERIQVTTKYEQMSDEELAALVRQQEEDDADTAAPLDS